MDKIIVITEPEPFNGEGAMVEYMLHRGIWRVHVRKRNPEEAETLISAIAPELRGRLSVHYFPDVAEKYGCGAHGYRLGENVVTSRSCHSIDELGQDVDYQFLSPIFDSISKEGYKSIFDLTTLRVPSNTIALGGVTPESFPALSNAGFGGAAMLGYVWSDHNFENIKKRIDVAIHHSHKL